MRKAEIAELDAPLWTRDLHFLNNKLSDENNKNGKRVISVRETKKYAGLQKFKI